MNNQYIIVLFTLLVLAIAGCSQTVTKYQCQDGSFANSEVACAYKECPALDCNTCPTKTEYQEKIVEKPVQVIKYQCADESIKDKLIDCPQIPEAKKISNVKTFSGDSDTVTDQFYLKEGLAIFKLKYDGDSNFQIYLIDEDGDKSIFVNEIGKYDATKAEKISPAGYYRLEIEIGTSLTGSVFSSNADWSVTIQQ